MDHLVEKFIIAFFLKKCSGSSHDNTNIFTMNQTFDVFNIYFIFIFCCTSSNLININ